MMRFMVVSPYQPDRLMALIHAEPDSGLYVTFVSAAGWFPTVSICPLQALPGLDLQHH
jgi:hypothetical protein